MNGSGGDGNFYHLAHLDVVPGKREEFLRELNAVMMRSVKEEGLVRCEIFQSDSRPDRISILDVFESKDAFELHLRQSYLAEFQKQTVGLLDGGERDVLNLLVRGKNAVPSTAERMGEGDAGRSIEA